MEKKTDNALKSSENFSKKAAHEIMHLMFDAMPLCCIYFDENYKSIDCNHAALELFGFTDKQQFLIEFNRYKLSPKRQPDGSLSTVKANEMIALTFEKGSNIFKWTHQKLGGELIASEVTLIKVIREGRTEIAGYIKDFREIKNTGMEPDKECMLLKEIFDSSPICFVIADLGGTAKFTTPFIGKFLGIKQGDNLFDFLPDKNAGAKIVRELRKKKYVSWHMLKVKTKYGEEKDMLANLFYFHNSLRSGVMVWLIDLTDIHRVELELMKARDAAETAAKAKSEFLANMSHEIRTPMNAIIGMTKIALNSENKTKIKEYLRKIDKSSAHLLNIINDILDLSKIDYGKFELFEEKFDLEYMLSGIVGIILVKIEEKEQDFTVKLASDVPKHLYGDSVRLTQVIMNLLSNAVKFTPRNGKIMLQVKLEKTENGIAIINFSISDNGIGMSSEQTERLFNAFEQTDSSITKRFGGTGLGLAISKRITEMMGGNINVKSIAGKGSVFEFSVRMSPVYNPQENIFNATTIKSLRMLIVDCDGDSVEYMSGILKKHKIETEYVCDGLIAIEKARAAIDSGRPYNVIFIDENISAMNSVHAVEMFKQMDAKVAIVMITKHRFDKSEELLDSAGISAFLQRPFFSSDIIDTIAAVSGIKRKRTLNTGKQKYLFSGKTIMLVEDIEINREIIINILAPTKVNIVSVENGRKAVEMFKDGSEKFDLILMDIQMPEMDGYTAASMIRASGVKNAGNIPIIALTANAFKEDVDAAFAAGMNGHLTKPINYEKMMKELGKYFKISGDMKEKQPSENKFSLEPYAHIEGIDVGDALKRLNNNFALLIILLKRFCDDNVFNELVSAIDKDNMKEASVRAHAIKGIASNLSFNALFESVKNLEILLKNGIKITPADKEFLKFKKDYQQVMKSADFLIKNPDLLQK